MQIALFDLDHTLIPFDSGSAFTQHMASRGALPPGFEAQYLDYCKRYAAGTVDMGAMHRFTVGALAAHEPDVLAGWLREFPAVIAPRVLPAAFTLVATHRDAGHACALVTATSRLVAEACATLFELAPDDVLATESARGADGRYTGEIVGEPCFQHHKRSHVERWLSRRGAGWNDVARSWFYSDSINDLPLLEAVTDPVVVDPDPKLLAVATARGWPVRRLATTD
jgi:HAD superfamily hydrolase (TIGR01490 family)